jgi:hypothetical protein
MNPKRPNPNRDHDSIYGQNFRSLTQTVLETIGVNVLSLTRNSSETVRDRTWNFRNIADIMTQCEPVKFGRCITVHELETFIF